MPLPTVELILQAVQTRLQTISGAVVERNRDTDVQMPNTLVIREDQQTVVSENSGYTQYTLDVFIEGYAKKTATKSVGQAINELYAAVVEKIAVDVSFSGLAIDTREISLDRDLSYESGTGSIGAFSLLLQISFMTPAGDPYNAGP